MVVHQLSVNGHCSSEFLKSINVYWLGRYRIVRKALGSDPDMVQMPVLTPAKLNPFLHMQQGFNQLTGEKYWSPDSVVHKFKTQIRQIAKTSL